MKDTRITRRDFFKSLLAITAVLGLPPLERVVSGERPEDAPFHSYLPQVTKDTSPAMSGRVVHVHSSAATNWDYNHSTYYGRTQTAEVKGVNQSVVNEMMDRGITMLFGLSPEDVEEAWSRLLPGYTPGKIVAVKVNFNNSYQSTCSSTVTYIDAIAQPMNALIRGLTQGGVREQDIILYDAIRSFSTRVYNELVFRNVQIHDWNGCRGHASTWNSTDADALVKFYPPGGGSPSVRICDTLVEADYLINMPIMKGHPLAGITLGFKNHFGSTNNPSGMHEIVDTDYGSIDTYNGLVDLFSNPHIRDKTVLTIGDAIYGSRIKHNTPPEPWNTFDNQSPCSLLLSTDPVAIDCVMHDLLKAERGSSQPGTSGSYLKLAQEAGLGLFEFGEPWRQPYGSGYTRITYKRVDL